MDLSRFAYQDKRGERSDVLPRLNRSELARACGISRSELSRILNGKVEPPVKTLRKIANALNASLDEVDRLLKELKSKKQTEVRG